VFIINTIKTSSNKALLFGLFVCSYGPSISGVNVNTSIIAWNWVGRWNEAKQAKSLVLHEEFLFREETTKGWAYA